MFRADSLPAALRPNTAPWAVRPALWALLAAGIVAGTGVATGNQVATGLAYFGVACAAVLVTSGVYRTRLISLAGQGIGAAVGLIVGVAVADSVPAKLAVAAVVAMLSGMFGAIGRLAAGTALMTVIGLSFGEFALVRLPGWEQGAWYLAGTGVVAVFALAGWPLFRDARAWAAVATVFSRSADLEEQIGRDTAAAARLDLAAASATSRTEVSDHRVSTHFGNRGADRWLREAEALAEQAAFTAAASFAAGRTQPAGVVDELRQAAADTREHRPPTLAGPAPVVRSIRPLPERMRAALRLTTSSGALMAGLRLALCMTAATAVTCALHSESHSFWLPLTVAVAVRPEYGSVFVRTVNRIAGTVTGALLAAAVIAVLGSGWPVAIAAAISLGFAALAVPKLYGLSVVGVTCSALLSSCIGAADPINPAIRLLDTLLGAAIAIVLGYLIWPRRKTAPVELAETAAAIAAYLDQAVTPPAERRNWVAVRDRAYQLAHHTRQDAQTALLDPPPVRDYAAEALPHTLALERLVDEVTALANQVDAGAPAPSDDVTTELTKRIWAAAGA